MIIQKVKKSKSGLTPEIIGRYVDWCFEHGVTKAQEMQAEVMKNLKKFRKELE